MRVYACVPGYVCCVFSLQREASKTAAISIPKRPHCNRSKRSLAGSLRFRPRLLGLLGRLGFCCLLLRALLRVLVSSSRLGLATTGLAAGALSVVLAYARAATLLALMALTIVFAPPTNPHLLGLGL